MRWTLFLLFWFVSANSVFFDSARAGNDAQQVYERVKLWLSNLEKSHLTIAAEFYDPQSDQALFKWNDQLPMNPASTLKLLTAKVFIDSSLQSESNQKTLHSMIHDSNNQAAERLLSKIGSGNREKGLRILKDEMHRLGGTEFSIESPSGLNGNNRLSCHQEILILKALIKDSKKYQTIFDALPVAGKPGSLKKWNSRSPSLGKIAAKTGWLKGTSALAGVLENRNQRKILFCILQNGTKSMSWEKFFKNYEPLLNWFVEMDLK